LTIDSIAAGGDGVGRIDGLACFVPRTAPGDRAQVAYIARARHARGRVLQLLGESPERVTPRCHHYVEDRCGGCQLQHLQDASQRDARVAIVRDALRRIGRRDATPAAIAFGEPWAYRGRLTLTLHRRGSGWIGGLHPYDDASRVFALTECPISHPALVSAWLGIAPMLRGLPEAMRLRVGLRLVSAADVPAPLVALVIEGGAAWHDGAAWSTRATAHGSPIRAVWWVRADGVRFLLAGEDNIEPAIEPAADTSAELVDDLAPHGRESTEALAFAQVNTAMGVVLRAHVLEQVLSFAPQTAVDGYAGVGLLAEALARHGVTVTAVESDRAATERAAALFAALPDEARGRARVLTDTMERGLTHALPAEVVVLNPPRRGLDAAVTSLLAESASRGTRAIVYVSCDPATLARDLTRLPGWRIDRLECVDMFPQTAHVETVCVLVPEGP